MKNWEIKINVTAKRAKHISRNDWVRCVVRAVWLELRAPNSNYIY